MSSIPGSQHLVLSISQHLFNEIIFCNLFSEFKMLNILCESYQHRAVSYKSFHMLQSTYVESANMHRIENVEILLISFSSNKINYNYQYTPIKNLKIFVHFLTQWSSSPDSPHQVSEFKMLNILCEPYQQSCHENDASFHMSHVEYKLSSNFIYHRQYTNLKSLEIFMHSSTTRLSSSPDSQHQVLEQHNLRHLVLRWESPWRWFGVLAII